MRRQHLITLLAIAGVAACGIAMRAAAQIGTIDELAPIRIRIAQLQDRLRKAEALRDIKRLQYSYAHYAEAGLWSDLGDLFATNGIAHYAQGDFKGPESLRKFYLQELGRGQMGLAEGRIYPHIMIQPVVTLAEGGKNARGRWHVIAMLGSYGASASWAGVVYENRYALEDGVWKISELSYNSQYSGRYSPPGLSISKWDLPFHFTPQSAGTPVANSPTDAPSLASENFEALKKRYVELVLWAQQLRDEADVLNLQHTYGYSFDQKNSEAVANLFAVDGTLELGQRGVYVGKDRIRRALNLINGERLSDGEVHDHLQLATVVHVAPGGKSAGARGVELSISGVNGKAAQWEEGIFENHYVKQLGVWKIQSVHYYPRVITDYELGWAKDAKPAAKASDQFRPDRPPTESYEIYPKVYFPKFHYANPVTGPPLQSPFSVVPNLPNNARELAARLNELEPLIQSSIAYDAVENLVSSHGYSLEDESRKDAPAVYQNVQPVISIAADGRSATIRARLLKIGGKSGELESGMYEGRAINRDGTWQLQSMTLKPAWSSPFTKWMPVIERRR